MAAVFISHSSANQDKAEELLKKLESASISCWFAPRDIPPGAVYSSEIPKAIGECTYFVLLLSNEAQNSPFVMLELDQAIKRRKEILPMALEQMDQNESTNFLINAKQAVDATKDFDGAVKKIIKTISDNFRNPDADSLHIKERRMVDCTKEICCPHCGCKIVKKQECSTGEFLSDQTAFEEQFTYFSGWRRTKGTTEKYGAIAMTIPIISVLVVLLLGVQLTIDMLSAQDLVMLIVTAGIVILLVTVLEYNFLCECEKLYDIFIAVKSAVQNTKLKYQKLKCAACEKEFGILIPADADLKKLIPDLIETDTPK